MRNAEILLPPELPPSAERCRLEAVRRYEILDTPPDGAFDRVTSLAARLFSVPISIITLVDEDRIWFKSKQGVEVEEIGRSPGLCASAILQHDAWVLPDARIDPRVLANPLVAGDFGLRFYAGVPLQTHDGYNLGTLCVIDRNPRTSTERELSYLKDLATLVMDQMELRLAARRAVSQKEILLQELHHRVKNNLQILMSVVSSSERRAQSEETVAFLQSLRHRLLAIGAAHESMRDAEAFGSGRTGPLLEQIAETIRSAFHSDVELATAIEDYTVPNEVLLPLALILNELLTNAFKHGSSNGTGRIEVSFQRSSGEFQLKVRDTGPGVRETETGAGGLGFVRGLTGQLGGHFDIQSGAGAACLVRFPARTCKPGGAS